MYIGNVAFNRALALGARKPVISSYGGLPDDLPRGTDLTTLVTAWMSNRFESFLSQFVPEDSP